MFCFANKDSFIKYMPNQYVGFVIEELLRDMLLLRDNSTFFWIYTAGHFKSGKVCHPERRYEHDERSEIMFIPQRKMLNKNNEDPSLRFKSQEILSIVFGVFASLLTLKKTFRMTVFPFSICKYRIVEVPMLTDGESALLRCSKIRHFRRAQASPPNHFHLSTKPNSIPSGARGRLEIFQDCFSLRVRHACQA
jgi:hypothetical protein